MLGPIGQTSIDQCVESVVSAVAYADQIGTTVYPCVAAFGNERNPEFADRLDDPSIHTIGGRESATRRVVTTGRTSSAKAFVVDADADGRLLVVSSDQVLLVEPDAATSRVVFDAAAAPPLSGPVLADPVGPFGVQDAAFGAASTVVVAVGSGIVEVDDGESRWLIEWVPNMGTLTPRIDGAPVPQDAGEPINDLTVDGDGSVLFVKDQGLFRRSTSGVIVPLLTPATPAPEDARLVPREVEVDGQLSVCCGGSQLSAVAVDGSGLIVVLDYYTGRLISIRPNGTIAWIGGVAPEDSACGAGCSLSRLLTDSPELASASTLNFQPATPGWGSGGVITFTDEGSLLIAMGAQGLVEVGIRR